MSFIVHYSIGLYILPGTKDEFGVLLIVIFQTTAHISLIRHRQNILLLLAKVSKIAKMMHFLEWKTLNILIISYVIYIIGMNCILLMLVMNSESKFKMLRRIKQSNFVSDDLKYFYVIFRDAAGVLLVFLLHQLVLSFTAYYLCICKCLKSFHLQFVSRSHSLILQHNIQYLLQIHHEIVETTSLADDFLSYPACITILNGMIGLFSFTYNFILELKVILNSNYLIIVGNITGILFYSTLLVVIILPGAAVNQAAWISKETAKCLPWRFPRHFMELKKILHQRSTFSGPTLWKIYTIENSLLISAFGTLVTYGLLVGTLGSVDSLDLNDSSA
ncbi:hypothetical protein HNY73_001167 [Argiope bruennichi]|uniref:Uncharacterized protein n=1 Tax=Argiope bruennichi TaxID=94029 RepID=A0A8T0G0V0_ARGBR|nr:hypothetical protein HNY73_001167 [Argiope bruennichi]